MRDIFIKFIVSIVLVITIPFFYAKGHRFRKNIHDQKRQSGLVWWLFGGIVNYSPSIISSNGVRMSGESKPPVWERVYNLSDHLYRKIIPTRNIGNCQPEPHHS